MSHPTLQNLWHDAQADTLTTQGRPQRGLFILGLFIPVVVGVLAFLFWRDSMDAKGLFPAAAIFAGAFMGVTSMLFTRVKDLTAQPRPEAGPDPVFAASVAFRSALYCTEIALLLNAVLVAAVIVPAGTGSQLLTSLAVALYVYMGIKTLILLQGLRTQMSELAGSRIQEPLS